MTTNHLQYSNDPVSDAAAYDAWQDELEQHQAASGEARAEEYIANCQSFMDACRKMDASALAQWATPVRDWGACSVGSTATRLQTLAEVMQDALESHSGPGMPEIMQIILNVAYGNNIVSVPEQARVLLERMADTWSRLEMNCASESTKDLPSSQVHSNQVNTIKQVWKANDGTLHQTSRECFLHEVDSTRQTSVIQRLRDRDCLVIEVRRLNALLDKLLEGYIITSKELPGSGCEQA